LAPVLPVLDESGAAEALADAPTGWEVPAVISPHGFITLQM
jgi:hypothetical protein